MRIPQARITAPAVHACLFALAYTFWLLFEKGTHSPARFDLFAVLWIADVPISVLVSIITLGTRHYSGVAFVLWGVLGTGWWYVLGISIEAWVKRFSRTRKKHVARGHL